MKTIDGTSTILAFSVLVALAHAQTNLPAPPTLSAAFLGAGLSLAISNELARAGIVRLRNQVAAISGPGTAT
jgi:hypothetical protein